MTLPEEREWIRVEEIARELEGLGVETAAARICELRALGEPESILSLVSSWLSLPAPAAPLGAGDVVAGRYTLQKKLGEGGMGSVWLASQSMINRDVAVKVIQPALLTPAARERFAREMQILGQLEHCSIVKIYDAGFHEHDGCEVPFFVMERIEGSSLANWAAIHRSDHAALLRLMSEVCAAVQHAHDRKIIHRDLKPSNIMVRSGGEPVILDFGVARLASGDAEEPGGFFSGTPHYAAPEQHLGRDRDYRSGESVDVYAVGAILFEILAGRRLFDFPHGTPIARMRQAILEDTPVRLAEALPGCHPLLDEIVAKAVRRDPVDRYYSISSLSRALVRTASQIDSPAKPASPWEPTANVTVPGTNWKLIRKLGEGSAGQVWLAQHEELEERRIFKFCDTEEKARTLKREMTLFRLLKERVGRNPHFIQYHEVSLDEPPWYLMMEDAQAFDLSEWCDQQQGGMSEVDLETRLEIVAQAAEALQAAHEAGIIHRDIKPANILVRAGDAVSPTGQKNVHAIIADFGIGQIVADELLIAGTRQGFTSTVANLRQSTFSGTMLYMAPEVLEGNETTARSDIYSLGVVLWQMLVGNLGAALDPANWPSRISDPLLRNDLARCLAGIPSERWTSAGEFASQLRALPQRRAAESRRQAELAARERAAYRRGIIRTASVAAVIVAIVAGLAIVATIQRHEARQARARSAMEQAENLLQLGNNAGRRQQGLDLLDKAATVSDAHVSLRTLAAGFLSLPDLVPITPDTTPSVGPAKFAGERNWRVTSPTGKLIVNARSVDEAQGAIDFLDSADGNARATFVRNEFPWVPVPEPGLVQFSPNERLLAIAGPKSSLHVLLCDTGSADLDSYLFAGAGLKCFAWHRNNRILATGNIDRTVRLWGVRSGQKPQLSTNGNNDFDLPPKLSVPAIDSPLLKLSGWRGAVCAVAFHPDGTWLAGLDDAGWLRIWSGFTKTGIAGLPQPSEAASSNALQSSAQPALVMETKLDRSGPDGRLEFSGNQLIVRHDHAPPLAFDLQPGSAFRETWVAPGLRRIAWSDDGKQLCAISSTDIYWLSRDSLKTEGMAEGSNPAGVAFEPSLKQWVVPHNDQYLSRWLSGAGNINSTAPETRWSFQPADKDRGSQFGMAAAGDRIAIYYARRLQFTKGGKPEDMALSAITGNAGGTFQDLLWNSSATLATIVFATSDGLRAESYSTTGDQTALVGAVSSRAERMITAGDGVHLIERGVDTGIGVVDARSGKRRDLDISKEARQNAPIAASPDGRWIAAVIDQNVLRLLSASDGSSYADLPPPRSAVVTFISWSPSGDAIAALTQDGFVQIWSLSPWRDWLTARGIPD